MSYVMRLLIVARHRRVRKPPLGNRRRTRRREPVHGVSQPDAAPHHGGPTGALDPAVRAVPVLGTGPESAAAVRQVELRARARRGRAGGSGPPLLSRPSASPWSDLPVGSGPLL